MDDRFDREEFLSDTQSGRRRSYTDEATKYPVRERRQPLRNARRENPVPERKDSEWEQYVCITRVLQRTFSVS